MYHEIIVAGVAISLIFAELTGLSPAGLIVPGYIALSMQTPHRVVYTLAVAVAAWGCARLLSRWMILYGRRRFAVLVLLAFAIDTAVSSLGLLPYDPGLIGVLVPGIMAQEMEKQGLVKSLLSLAVVVGILVLIMMWQGMRVLPL
ncbi:MAG: poly-gamma-glutamate biosynthesis protein PgsC [Clostridiales bacterium]|nr:poly-gamma-glutamate biosynthesis protein PgsC [Clostridiales bacterium]